MKKFGYFGIFNVILETVFEGLTTQQNPVTRSMKGPSQKIFENQKVHKIFRKSENP